MFRTHNEDAELLNKWGGSRKGTLYLSYKEIKAIFGKCSKIPSADHKVEFMWHIQLDNGYFFDISNYKDGPKYTRNRKNTKSKINEWSIHTDDHGQQARNFLRQIFGDDKVDDEDEYFRRKYYNL